MANYYNEISKLIDKLLQKGLMFNENGFKMGVKGEIFTFLELSILRKIAMLPEQKISELIEDMHVNRSLMTSLIKKLIAKGYMEKTQSTEDRRVYLLKLTKSGNYVVEESYRIQKENLDFILNDISLNEEKAILKFLSKLNQLDKYL